MQRKTADFINIDAKRTFKEIDMDSPNTFDRMVSGISQEERMALLSKMQSQEQTGLLSEDPKIVEDDLAGEEELPDLETSLKKESVFFRFWLWLMALIKSDTIQNVYNNELVAEMARKLQKENPNLLDYRSKYLLETFYNSLVELKACIEFFKPYADLYSEDEGAFLVLLGSLIMPGVESEIGAQVDPYTMPFDRQITGELRVSLIHKMDDILKDLPAQERSVMYAGARAMEWLKAFVKLPVETLLTKFSHVVVGSDVCSFSAIDTEIAQCARILIRGFKIPTEVLEALYLFSVRNESGDILDADSSTGGAEAFIQKAKAEISMIDTFIMTVPMKQIGCIVYNNARWQPEAFGGGENWFVKFKTQWRKVFDSRWESWVRECKKEKLRVRMQEYFKLSSFPQFPLRPWKEISVSLTFRYELTIGFLYSFYENQYPEYSRPLKIMMLEGQFRQKDNQTEFSEQFNVLENVGKSLRDFKKKLSATGDYGAQFEKFEHKSINAAAQLQIDSVFSEMESEVNIMIRKFGNACRIIDLIISGAMNQRLDTRYDALINLNTIQGHENKQFRQDLLFTQVGMAHVLEMLGEIEAVDVPVLAK